MPQETFLFSETIANNIAFGKENASFTEVENAARAAAVYDNIMLFENKFETVLGERGDNPFRRPEAANINCPVTNPKS